jgi:hypothetical protein
MQVIAAEGLQHRCLAEIWIRSPPSGISAGEHRQHQQKNADEGNPSKGTRAQPTIAGGPSPGGETASA